MKKIINIILILLLTLVIVGCSMGMDSSNKIESKAMEESLQEMNREIGMPFIDNFFEKKMAKQIFELRDDSTLITYVYMTNLEGRFIYLGKGIGYGLPYSVQYTNPDKLINRFGGSAETISDVFIVPQADPNGLYMPDGLSATWLMLINEETGETEIIYTEPSIVVTQSKLPKRLVASWSLPKNY